LKIFDYLRILLIALGLIQIIGFATGQKWLKGIGKITVASPLPIVFTEQEGCETFALDFSIEYEEENGSRGLIPVTPKVYANFDEPYNYRNVLGAAISYGAILPEKIWRPIIEFAFLDPGTIGQTFIGSNDQTKDEQNHSLPEVKPLRHVIVHLRARTAGRENESWELRVGEASQ
tara:strand:+ start:1071 stop:1595 length:525 start_codon:yes stop_codon:yes gene_type:complete